MCVYYEYVDDSKNALTIRLIEKEKNGKSKALFRLDFIIDDGRCRSSRIYFATVNSVQHQRNVNVISEMM